jgi:hypothetical protein
VIGMSETLILAELSSGVELVNSRSRNCPKSRERESWIGVPTVPPYQTAYPYRSAPLAHVRFAPESRLKSDIAPSEQETIHDSINRSDGKPVCVTIFPIEKFGT